MSIIVDLIVVALSCFIVINAAKKGFVQLLVQVVGFILAFVIASAISTPLSNEIFDGMIAPSVTNSIADELNKKITKKDTKTINNAVEEVFKDMPEFVVNYLNNTGLKQDTVVDSVTDFTDGDYKNVAVGIVNTLIKPLIVMLLETVIFLVLLSLLMIAVRIVSRFVRPIKKIPVIGTLNSFLGGVLGVLKASAIIYIIAALVKLFVICTGNANEILNETVIADTFIFNIFYKYNLFSF